VCWISLVLECAREFNGFTCDADSDGSGCGVHLAAQQELDYYASGRLGLFALIVINLRLMGRI